MKKEKKIVVDGMKYPFSVSPLKVETNLNDNNTLLVISNDVKCSLEDFVFPRAIRNSILCQDSAINISITANDFSYYFE